MDDIPDISAILRDWPFDEENNIRKVRDTDGREKIQVRIDHGAFQGILQMELDGRPDGQRPHGHDFALDYYRDLARKREKVNGAAFNLKPAACSELFDESRRMYERYVFLLQLSEYERVIRDTARNMDLFRFVNTYAHREEDRQHLERWWPYILRINGVARAMVASRNNRYAEALELVADTRKAISELPELVADEFQTERQRSYEALDELEQELERKKPLSMQEHLEHDLAEAVADEDFERAARLRDRLAAIEAVRDLPVRNRRG